MSSHEITVLIWLLLVSIALLLELVGRMEGSRIPTWSALMGSAMRSRSGRVGILAAWLWIGMHFFSR